jgi:pyrimidine operon attenuation protein / uracil phosphoribosyltransferase
MSTVLLDAEGMKRTLQRMAHEITEANQGAHDVVCVGILRRGYPLAKRLAFAITQIEGITIPCGKLDISGSRDDRTPGAINATEIPFEIKGKNVILVDEVLYTGRTVRAALDALLKHGRPKKVQLAVLVDRGHRQLPIQPDFVGKTAPTESTDHVLVKFSDIDGEDLVVVQPLTGSHS